MKDAIEFLRGSVRPLVTFAFVALISYGFISGKADGGQVLGIGGMVVAFWFGSRKTA